MGQPRPTLSELDDDFDFKYHFFSASLAEVVTMPEAILLWGKSKMAVVRACDRFEIDFRVSVTGGATLITVASLVNLWGKPSNDLLEQLRILTNAAEKATSGYNPDTDTTVAVLFTGDGLRPRTYAAARRRQRAAAARGNASAGSVSAYPSRRTDTAS